MNVNIAVVNASVIQQTRTKDALESYNSDEQINLIVRYFLSGKELLKDIERNGSYELYLMDVVIPEMDGLMIAERLRSDGDRGKLVYLNGDQTHAHRAFKVNADEYLLWPLNRADLKEAMDKVLIRIREDVRFPVISIKTRTGIIRTRLNNLVYVESVDRIAHYHLIDGSVYYSKFIRNTFISEVSNLLEYDGIISAGSSYLINLEHVKVMDKKSGIGLWTGDVLTPPKYKWADIKEAWEEYLK